MHPTHSQLCADHFNFLRLLRCLEAEIACYEAGNTSDGRLPVILDILDYVQHYPEKWHHPLEDVVFELLLIKQVENSDHIWGIKSEHKALEELTRRAVELFTAVANDAVVSRDELLGVAREFIQRQLDHINRENRLIYPLLGRYISPREWDEITKKVEARHDPLFTKSVREEYRNLYHTIVQSERGLALGATARGIDPPASAVS